MWTACSFWQYGSVRKDKKELQQIRLLEKSFQKINQFYLVGKPKDKSGTDLFEGGF
jgi:hypothetical protein